MEVRGTRRKVDYFLANVADLVLQGEDEKEFIGNRPLIGKRLNLSPKRGRPRILNWRLIEHVRYLYFRELRTVREIANLLGVSHMTVWRALKTKEAI
jgi:DNA invertase Pin-like site-specific DNA recombinase